MELAIQAISENLDVAAGLIAVQLSQGLKKDGTKSDFSYSPFTIAVKKKNRTGLAAVTEYLTNYDTGESYKQLYGKVKGFLVEFGTKTDKDDAISQRMEGKAFGLTPDSSEEWIRQHVQQAFMELVINFLSV